MSLRKRIGRFIADESGTTAVEYALIASLICIAIVGALQATGQRINTTFNLKSQL